MPNILPNSFVVCTIGLQVLSPQNSSTPEAITTTLSFSRSDKPVYTTVSIRPISPCQPTQTLAGPVFSHLCNPQSPFQAEFMDASMHHWGARMGGCQISGTWTHSDHKLHINGLELKALFLAFHHWATVLQGHQVMKAMDNTTVVSYIHKQGGNEQGETHSLTLFPPVVDQVLWLQTQGITIRTRHISGCLNVIADCLFWSNRPMATEWSLHPEILNRIFGTGGTPTVDMFATVYNTHLPQFMSLIQDPRALAIDALSQDW